MAAARPAPTPFPVAEPAGSFAPAASVSAARAPLVRSLGTGGGRRASWNAGAGSDSGAEDGALAQEGARSRFSLTSLTLVCAEAPQDGRSGGRAALASVSVSVSV